MTLRSESSKKVLQLYAINKRHTKMIKNELKVQLAQANAKKAVKANLCQTQYNSGYRASNNEKGD